MSADSCSKDVRAGAKWFTSTFLGKDFADDSESSVFKTSGNTKRRKPSSSTSTPLLSPIITKHHTVSFYDDPRDKIPSDLSDNED